MPRRQPSPTSEPLGSASLITAALELIDTDGFAALSMRRLAARFGVDPMALYYYVPSKAALVRLIVEHVFSALPALPSAGDWRWRLQFWAQAYRDLVLVHPNLILPMLSDVEAVQSAVYSNRQLFAAMQAGGFSPDLAEQGAGVLVDFVHGFVLAGDAVRNETEYFRFGVDVILDGLEAQRA